MLRYTTFFLLILSFTFRSEAQIVEWDNCRKFLGNVSYGEVPSNWLTYWNQVTPENGGKWGSVERTRDQMDWADLDIAYNLAKDNNLLFKQHVFVWGNQQPGWIEDLPEDEQLEEIREWVRLMCERYPDIELIEVVNEPINDPPFGPGNGDYGDALGGTGITGWDWLVEAFKIAKEYCPNAALMLNEYNILNNVNNRSMYKLITELLKEEELIDAIGVQAHAFSVNNMSASQITSALNELGTLELPIYVTELDIDTEGYSGSDHDSEQLRRYQEIFPAIWGHQDVDGVTMWGYVKDKIWRESAWLVDGTSNSSSERPAMEWLKGYINQYNSGCEVTSINSPFENYGLKVYPNPFQNSITISQNQITPFNKVQLLDLNGRIVMDRALKLTDEDYTLDLGKLNRGMYVLRLHSQSGETTSQRVFKE